MPNIDDFKSKLTGGGARPNLFRAIVNYPAFANGDSELTSFMVKAASLPASIVAEVVVPFRGRQIKVAGDRTFEPMSLTVINDTGMEVRNAFEKWSHEINTHVDNTGINNPTDYKADLVIEQLDRQGAVVKKYTLIGAFPTNISAIELSSETNDTIEEFTAEISYDYWTTAEL
jgi:hypothetical protein